MNKKRCAFPISNTQGQITIFMILGIVILVVFLFLLFIVQNIQKTNLQLEQTQVFETIYSQEGINLYLDDCLKTSLSTAVSTVGKQGRLWRDINQGGFIPFEEGITGVTVAGVPIFYGLRYTPNLAHPEAYPCAAGDGEPPVFCGYNYPDTSLRFGTLELQPTTLEDDIQGYLQAKVIECAQSLATEKIAENAVAEVQNPTFAVTLQDKGIAVEATIPFLLVLHGVRYFTTSSFQFFYETPLQDIVETAAYFPLQADRNYVDFDYSENTLIAGSHKFGSPEDVKNIFGNSNCVLEIFPGKDFYRCTKKLVSGYSTLGVDMVKEDLPNGDTLFTFSSPEVEYTIARQNRPPALDYISRYACPAGEYDYLAIAGHPDLGVVEITATASDPDEQVPHLQVIAASEEKPLLDENSAPETFLVSNPVPGRYIVKATAEDEYLKSNLRDEQVVRILVDPPLISSIKVHHNYPGLKTATDEGIALVSPEDPITVEVNLPEKSLSGNLGEFHFSFINPLREIPLLLFPEQDSPIAFNEYAFQFPHIVPQPSGEELIESIVESELFEYAPFVDVGQQGTLLLDYTINYCGYQQQSSTTKATVVVSPCLPYQNPDHPFPYPYHEYVDKDGDGLADQNSAGDLVRETIADPFDATHACCIGDPDVPQSWSLADSEKSCFASTVPEDEALGCFGDVNPGGKGYLLEKRSVATSFCSGIRGNLCGDVVKYEAESQNTCGDTNVKTCNLVAPQCAGLTPYSKGDGFWCSGPVGCGDVEKKACTSEIVTKVTGLGFAVVELQPEQYACECTTQTVGWDCLKLSSEKVGKCSGFTGWFDSYSCKS
ncbi:hypothetical protein HY495_01845 [Candidatus Woesearchaeota archaeon]|nr:hypothetical protein [Candidatus Woesearchaeota archaeon]